MVERVQRAHTKGQIDRAGEYLLPWWKDGGDVPKDGPKYYEIIQNWRSSHALPLHAFRVVLQGRAKRLDPKVLIAQRLKRFSSVMNKLAREETMQLSQMQDLGGCRAIVDTVEMVREIYDVYRTSDDHNEAPLFISSKRPRCFDYIQEPKPDGYRGIHIVGRYAARAEINEPWNGHRIEIQLRSKLQHAFATTVETVTTFTREPLKFGAGPESWQRFFALVGSALAIREGTPLVPGTPDNRSDLVRELREFTEHLDVHRRLRNWTNAIKQLPRKNVSQYKWLLLVLDLKTNEISVTGYAEKRQAARELEKIEKGPNAKSLDAVMVWVRSIYDLRDAYPNYYADTTDFVKALDVAMAS